MNEQANPLLADGMMDDLGRDGGQCAGQSLTKSASPRLACPGLAPTPGTLSPRAWPCGLTFFPRRPGDLPGLKEKHFPIIRE